MAAIYLLEWLAKEETSAYGECEGKDFSNLRALGLADFVTPPLLGEQLTGYERVHLTAHGRTMLVLVRITQTKFEGSCCGCSRDAGFTSVQNLAREALGMEAYDDG